MISLIDFPIEHEGHGELNEEVKSEFEECDQVNSTNDASESANVADDCGELKWTKFIDFLDCCVTSSRSFSSETDLLANTDGETRTKWPLFF